MTALEELHAFLKPYKGLNSLVNDFLQERGSKLPDWPEWCFLPVAAWYSVVSARYKVPFLSPNLIQDVPVIAALGTWRYTQGIYQFNKDLAQELLGMPMEGSIPVEVLYRLPEWCVYIELPEPLEIDFRTIKGFWTHLEYDVNTTKPELRVLLHTNEGIETTIPLHLEACTVADAIGAGIDESMLQMMIHDKQIIDEGITKSGMVDYYKSILTPFINLILFLCSDTPEIDNERKPGSSPSHPQPKKTKKGLQLFPTDTPTIWKTGFESGNKLRTFNHSMNITGRHVRAHVRRGHWHGVWTGPKTGKQTFKYNWMPPMIVGGD